MGKNWVMGMVGAIAVLAVTGIGFAAFTATATVNGTASAGSVDLQITSVLASGCQGFNGATAGNATIAFSSIGGGGTSVSVTATNLTPAVACFGDLTLKNTGSVPLNLSVSLNTPGSNGVCVGGAIDCYDVDTYSGIEDSGWIAWCGPCSFAPLYSVTGFTTLNPGQSYSDAFLVSIPYHSDDGTPASGTFSLVYTGTAGI